MVASDADVRGRRARGRADRPSNARTPPRRGDRRPDGGFHGDRGFPAWQEKTEGVIAPDERLPWPQTVAMGAQHVVAMFGATVLAPLLMGFDPNVAVLMSGVGTLVFFADHRRARAVATSARASPSSAS